MKNEIIQNSLEEISEEEINIFVNNINQEILRIKSNDCIMDLSELTIFSKEERGLLSKYFEKYPKEKSILFLNRVVGLDVFKKKYVFYQYCSYGLGYGVKESGKARVMISCANFISKEKSPFRYRNSLFYSKDNWSFSILVEKDPTEENIVDFVNFSFSKYSKSSQIMIGNYQINFGKVLGIRQGFLVGNISSDQYNSSILRKHTGSLEYSYFTGVGFSTRLKPHLELLIFGSYKHRDMTIKSEGNTLRNTGIHSSKNDLKFRKNLLQKSGGIGLRYENGAWSFQHLFHSHHYSDSLLELASQDFLQSHYQSVEYRSSKWTFCAEIQSHNYHFFDFYGEIQYAMGNRWFMKVGTLKEGNQQAIFSNYQDLYADSEDLFFGKISKKRKKYEVQYAFIRSQNSITKEKKNRSQLDINLRLSRKYRLRNRLLFQKTTHSNDLAVLKSRFELDIRASTSFDFELQSKIGREHGFALFSHLKQQFENCELGFGFGFFHQDSGAFYSYEPDVFPMGRVIGYYKSGMFYYFRGNYRFRNWKFEAKFRRIDQILTTFGGSFGMSYSF
ncbi:MAG: hypothetical protein N4A45_13605 [Flavobacteriales bacterium]|nr:hypothetical protein [Flavobacteriales bacterium]